MKISDSQKAKYSAFMQDLWGLIKEYRNPEPGDDYWRELRDRTTAISEKYGNDELVMNLLVGLVKGLGEELKAGV